MNAFTRIAYDHFGTALLVSGERDQFECVVERITASDSSIDLFDMLPPSTVQTISDRIDRQLSAEARQQRAMRNCVFSMMSLGPVRLPF